MYVCTIFDNCIILQTIIKGYLSFSYNNRSVLDVCSLHGVRFFKTNLFYYVIYLKIFINLFNFK